MSDDPTKTGAADDIRINVAQNWELSYWARKFSVLLGRKIYRSKLRAAIKEVGPMVRDVQAFLSANK